MSYLLSPSKEEIQDMTHGRPNVLDTKMIVKTISWSGSKSHEPKVSESTRPVRKQTLPSDDERLGITRPSMKDNPILASSIPKVGKRSVPTSKIAVETVHGLPSIYTGTVAETLVHRPKRPATAPAASSRRLDYVKFNKVAVNTGLVTAREQQALRETTKFYRPTSAAPMRSQYTNEAAKTMVHGVPTPEQDDIVALVSMSYRKDWIQQQRQRDQQEVEARLRRQNLQAGTTKTVLLRQKGPQPAAPEPFVLKQFRNIPPAVSSFRSPAERERALLSQSLDGVARVGYQHQGVYASQIGAE